MVWLVGLLGIVPVIWLAGFLWATDFAVPRRDIRALRRVLVIFPHADDEAVTCGGLLHRLSRQGAQVTLVILTGGERGTPDGQADPRLKILRGAEAQAAAAILGISRCVQADFGDGQLSDRQSELIGFLQKMIAAEQPDLLITFDRAGLYGHADHIACAEVVTDLRARMFSQIPLWYVTFPRRILAWTRLPAHMRATPGAASRRALPTGKVFIGAHVVPKIRAWYAYKSQRAALTTGIRRALPIWFFLAMVLYEYVAEAVP